MGEKALLDIGFSKNEAHVYLSLLELGPSGAGRVATKSNVHRTNTYEALNRLSEKGMVSYIIKNGKKLFEAEHPQELLKIVKRRTDNLSKILPSLELKKSMNAKQIAVVHDGFKAFRAMFNKLADQIQPKEPYWAFAFKEEYHSPAASLFLKKFHQRLAQKNVDDRLLAHHSIKKEFRKTFKGNENLKFRFTDVETPSGVIITNDKVIILLWEKNPTAIEINSPQIYEQYHKFFSGVWDKGQE